MKISPIKTHPITKENTNIFSILEDHIRSIKENSIIAVTSKIVSICEGNTLPLEGTNKEELIHSEADFYIPSQENQYGITLTIKNSLLIPTAGIDESNADGDLILWPKDPQLSANEIRAFLKKKFNLKNFGVLITDSKTTPLRWGTTGVGLAYSGFAPLKNYIEKFDIFGRRLKATKANIMDGLAAAAVLVMGEGDEQTPIAIIEDIPFVEFKEVNPSQKELNELKIDIEDDIYAPILKSAHWKKGKE